MSEPQPENERNPKKQKQERFVRVAERRTRKVLQYIRLLSKCSNRMSYSYSESDVNKIFAAIQKELDHTRGRFIRRKEISFSLTEEDEK